MIKMSNEDVESIFHKPHSLLSTMSLRTQALYAFGYLGKKQRNQIDCIRHVRNAFAHALKPIKFTTPLVVRECDKLVVPHSFSLKAIEIDKKETYKRKFVVATFYYALYLHRMAKKMRGDASAP